MYESRIGRHPTANVQVLSACWSTALPAAALSPLPQHLSSDIHIISVSLDKCEGNPNKSIQRPL
jgi:hypothetical protein